MLWPLYRKIGPKVYTVWIQDPLGVRVLEEVSGFKAVRLKALVKAG